MSSTPRPTSRVRPLAIAALLGALAALPPAPLAAATFRGRNVDDRWYDGRAVSTTYGAYDCQMKFHGDRVFMRLQGVGVELVGVMDDEVITDPHDIVVNDPLRGVDWSLDCFNLGS
jgi:hypothetical protein